MKRRLAGFILTAVFLTASLTGCTQSQRNSAGADSGSAGSSEAAEYRKSIRG